MPLAHVPSFLLALPLLVLPAAAPGAQPLAWAPLDDPFSERPFELAATPDGHILAIATGQDGVQAYDPDGGTWTALGLDGIEPLDALIVDGDGTIHVATDLRNGIIASRHFRSTDGGATWEHLHDFEDLSRAFGLGDDGVLLLGQHEMGLRSTDDGETWAYTNAAASVFLHVGGGTLYAIDNSYLPQIRRSDDNGASWQFLSSVLFAWSALAQTDDGVFRGTFTAVTVEAEPVALPVVIPAEGGAFDFSATFTNHTGESQTFTVWTSVTGPVSQAPVIGYHTLTVPGGGAVSRTVRQQVPGAAPAGLYTYSVNAFTYTGTVAATDAFTLTKEGSAATPGASHAEEWTASPWDEAASVSEAPGAAFLTAGPNPFRSSTTLRYALPEASAVRLSVYDALGREMVVLVDGHREAGPHEVSFDAAGMPNGVYLVRLEASGQVSTRRVTVLH